MPGPRLFRRTPPKDVGAASPPLLKLPRLNSDLLRYSNLGLEMGVAIVVGLLIGLWLDRVFGTRPWLTIVFLLFGIGAGFKNMFLLLRKAMDTDDRDKPTGG
jgi:ATP synthase protein I